MKSIDWPISSPATPFFLGAQCAGEIAAHLQALKPDRLFVCADPCVWRLYGQSYQSALSQIAPAQFIAGEIQESGKSLQSVQSLASRLIAAGATRQSILVAMGGGVVGNLTGLTAALLFRGIRFVHLPTTLLAMHDSVTSLKQGVNLDGAKNILGVFYAPSAIFIDLQFLNSLPQPQVRAGLAELVKNALILGGEYAIALAAQIALLMPTPTESVWTNLIELGISAKRHLMRDDPNERGPALALEYGHTIGHALELAAGGALNHGDAIAWGMHAAAWVSHHLGYMDDSALAAHDRLLELLGGLPRPETIDREEITRRIRLDNKRGYLPTIQPPSSAMVLLHKPGTLVNSSKRPPLTEVPATAIEFALRQLQRAWQD